MDNQPSNFKIGLFVIIALMLAVIGIIWLSGGVWGQDYIFFETYIDESIQGLEVGAPVKYRGVQIGQVDNIDFVTSKYQDIEDHLQTRYVLLELAIERTSFKERTAKEIGHRIRLLVLKGMRVRLKSQGLTGLTFVETDYLDPRQHPPLAISWKPEYHYVPYAPSITARITESVDSINNILKDLKNSNLRQVIEHLSSLIVTAEDSLKEAQFNDLSTSVVTLVDELKTTNDRLRDKIEELNIRKIQNEMIKLIEKLNVTNKAVGDSLAEVNLENIQTQIIDSLTELQDTGQALRLLVTQERVDHILTDVELASRRIATAAKKLDRAISTQENMFRQTLENLNGITSDVKELTGSAKRYPAQIIFGEPPPRSIPGKP